MRLNFRKANALTLLTKHKLMTEKNDSQSLFRTSLTILPVLNKLSVLIGSCWSDKQCYLKSCKQVEHERASTSLQFSLASKTLALETTDV